MTQYKKLLEELKTLGTVIETIQSADIRKIKRYSDYTYYDGPINIILKSGKELYVDYYTDDTNHCIVTKVRYDDIHINLKKLVEPERIILEDKILSLFDRITDRFPKTEGYEEDEINNDDAS